MMWSNAEVYYRVNPKSVPHCFIRDQQKVTQPSYQIAGVQVGFCGARSSVHIYSLQTDDCRKRQAMCFYDLIFVKGHQRVMSSHFAKYGL